VKTPFVYLAHPVDFADRDYADQVALTMQAEGMAAYVPGYAFKVPLGIAPVETLQRINRAALSECDGLVAVLPERGEVSLGVPMEIEQARNERKPRLIVGDSALWARSWALPKDDLTVYTDEFSASGIRELAALITREKRRRDRPPTSSPMYVRLDPQAELPSRAYSGDAGFDLYVSEPTMIRAGEFVDVPMGCAVQLPDSVWAMITGRSSTVRKLDLLVTTGIIDTGYRGPLFAGVRSLRTDDYLVKPGERIAQLIPLPNLATLMHATPVDVLATSDRGESGFGSSGA
jgi:dUTP pyrophosphatase